MNCKRYQRLLHLNRPGEISSADADDLREHLRHCERCRAELLQIQHADGYLQQLRSFEPVPTDANKLTSDILHHMQRQDIQMQPQRLLDPVFDFFLRPSVQYAAIASIIVTVLLFALQSLSVLNHISMLEQQVSSSAVPIARVVYTARSQTLREITASQRIQPLSSRIPVSITDGQIQIPAREADALLSLRGLGELSSYGGSLLLPIDRTTLAKIVGEVRATAMSALRVH